MEEGAGLERRGPSLTALLRWSGLVLIAGAVLLVMATVLHPSRETPATIVESEVRLVAAPALFTLSYLLVLLGLPGLYGAASVRMGRLGLVGFLAAFTGTMLIAVSGSFGFLAPVLATQSPPTIDAINRYLPEMTLNGVAFGGFVVGFVVFGMAMAKTATFPRASGILVAVGAPAKWLDSPWPSLSPRRRGRLPSWGAWPLAPALPGLAIACGRPGILTRGRARRRLPIPITQHGRPDKLRRREILARQQARSEVSVGVLDGGPPRPWRLKMQR